MGCAAAGCAVQKVLPVRGGLNAYLVAPEGLVDERSRECPFCPEKHRLRLHGHYRRCVLVEGGRTARVPVRRLLCPHTGRTLSLLPDFCIPRRQHGAAIVGTFLAGYAAGKPILAALRAVRPEAPGHSVAQSLRRGFLARAGPIRAYLARLHARAVEAPPSAPGLRREVSALLVALCLGFAKAAEAFVHHGVGLHASSLTQDMECVNLRPLPPDACLKSVLSAAGLSAGAPRAPCGRACSCCSRGCRGGS